MHRAQGSELSKLHDVICEVRGRTAWLRLARPQALNALTLGMLDAIADTLSQLETDDPLCVGDLRHGTCSGGSSVRLPRKVGSSIARQMMFTGEVCSAAMMKQAGLVTHLVADTDVELEADRLTLLLARHSPLGLRRMKTLLEDSMDVTSDAALAAEQRLWAVHAVSNDMNGGLLAFREKRPPQFSGD